MPNTRTSVTREVHRFRSYDSLDLGEFTVALHKASVGLDEPKIEVEEDVLYDDECCGRASEFVVSVTGYERMPVDG